MADRGVRPTWKATPFGHITQEQCDAFEARMNATAATVQDDDTPLIVAVRQGRAAGLHSRPLPHFQRQGKEQPMFELWMTNVMPNEVTRDYQPPAGAGAD